MGQVVAFQSATGTEQPQATDHLLTASNARERIAWTLERFPGRTVLTSSFGAQSAVMLHMATREQSDLPVVLVDTGYLFPETYRFVDDLTERLGLNLHVYRPRLSAAWQEARYGRLWQQGAEGIERYNRMNKIEPMQRALHELDATAWLSGIRRDQSTSRVERRFAEDQNGRLKIHPILDWSDRDIYKYLKAYDLPYHPLWHQGYISIGDWHTTRRPADGVSEEDARFFGVKRECGLHTEV
jgi:phosphoadenosine phosphosulfate reductase